jgi:hypothetical protein
MVKIKFIVEDEAGYFRDLDEMYPKYKLELESEGDTLTSHLEAFKMVMKAIGYSEELTDRIKAEGMQECMERYLEETEIKNIKEELYVKYLEELKEED